MARGIIEFMTIMILTIVGILMVIIVVSSGVDKASDVSKNVEPQPIPAVAMCSPKRADCR